LENLHNNLDINRPWKSIRENIETSAKKRLGHYKSK
jgi:hypothetical protein